MTNPTYAVADAVRVVRVLLPRMQMTPVSANSATSNDPAPPTQRALPRSRLGRTGEFVTRLGLGGSHIGKPDLTTDESVALIRHAIDQGVTFMDNCWDYNGGKSEERMGRALRDGYRERVFLMTKVDGRTRDVARAQLEQSLRRLQTEQIDLVQIHEVIRHEDPARCFAADGVIHALTEARDQGLIRYIGFTGHKHPTIHLAMLECAKANGFEFDTVQMPLNVMDAHFESFERRVLPVLLERDIGVLGMKSMGSGDLLASKVVSARECLLYALSLPTSVVISGMDSMQVLEANLDLLRNFEPLSEAEREELLARTHQSAKTGQFEPFKTSTKYDGTVANPHWLTEARA
ncbi:MAG TPA: aldo/keto reductase [Polyangiaceae bacterium]|nr:aldo/keto reductase [Polyangiaceae bacterium]